MDALLVVGPMAPATKQVRAGFAAMTESAAARAFLAPATLSS
jgi:hypothetical protein